MKKNKKIILIALTIFIFSFNFAFGQVVEDKKHQRELRTGVTYEKIERLTDDGWIMINLLTVDLTNRNIDLQPLHGETLNSLSTLSSMMANDNSIIAGTNGDFYDPNRKVAVGPMIKNNQLITSGSIDEQFNKFFLTTAHYPYILNTRYQPIDITIGQQEFMIDYQNKDYRDQNKTIIFNQYYGDTLSAHENHYNIMIENGQVKNIALANHDIQIPENGFILSIPKELYETHYNIAVNDSARLQYAGLYNAIKFGIGGGSIILDNGQVASDVMNTINGHNPRTAIGYSEDGSTLYLMTVDGRQNHVKGVTQQRLAELMKEFGAYRAINLDGGGSTEMIIKNNDNLEVVNHLSDGAERKIANGIGIQSNYEIGFLNRLSIETIDNKIINNASRSFEVYGFDEHGNPLPINLDEVNFSSTLKGSFDKNTFYPIESGTGKINADYRGIETSIDIQVINTPAEINLSPTTIKGTIDDTTKINASIITQEGFDVPIHLNDLALVENEIVTFEDKNSLRFLKDVQDQSIDFTFNDLSIEVPVNTENYTTEMLEDFESMTGENVVYPDFVSGRYRTMGISKQGNASGQLFFNFKDNKDVAQASYLKFNNPIRLEKKPDKIGLWVFGYFGNDHWLRMQVQDAYGTTHNLTLARNINWEQWQYVETEIPEYIEGPIKIERLYVVETALENASNGSVLFDNLEAKYRQEETIDKRTNYAPLNYQQLPQEAFEFDNYYHTLSNNTLSIYVNNDEATIINDGGQQWEFIFNQLNNSTYKNANIILSNGFKFKDPLEKEFFIEKLQSFDNISIYTPTTNNPRFYKGLTIIE